MNPKVETYKSKISKLEEELAEVEPPYKEARGKFERFLHLKGAELLEEWGIWGTEIKLIKKLKTSKMDDSTQEDSKIVELDLDQEDRSYLGRVLKSKTKRSNSTIKTPEKKVKHSVTMMSPSEKYAAPVAHVDLDDGAVPTLETKDSPSVEVVEDKLMKMIGKTPVSKSTKLSAPLTNGKDHSLQKCSETVIVSKKEKNMHGIAPVKQLFLNEEVNDSPSESKTKLTTETLRSNNLGSKRKGLTSSLVNFAMEDVARVNKVKSEYNQNTKPTTNVGSIFKWLDLTNTLSGMLMVNNGLTPQSKLNQDEENCSLVSGATLKTFQNFSNPMMPIGGRLFSY